MLRRVFRFGSAHRTVVLRSTDPPQRCWTVRAEVRSCVFPHDDAIPDPIPLSLILVYVVAKEMEYLHFWSILFDSQSLLATFISWDAMAMMVAARRGYDERADAI